MEITQRLKDDMKERIRSRLSPRRYRHSLNVAARARELAARYGEDPGRAEYAGLAHDICKDMDRDELLALIRAGGVEPDALTLRMPQLFHAIAGACYLRGALGVDDEEILNAVRYHTTGRAGMSRLEVIVYLADLTSADRDYADAARTRKIVDKSLEEGMIYSYSFIIAEMLRKQKPICADTFEGYNDMILKRSGDRGGRGA